MISVFPSEASLPWLHEIFLTSVEKHPKTGHTFSSVDHFILICILAKDKPRILLPFDTFYLIALKPGLIFPGPRPMLICMAILYTSQVQEDSRPAWIHKQSHIHQVATSSIYLLRRMEGNEKSYCGLKARLTRAALWSSWWVKHSIILTFPLSNTCGLPFWALDM